MVSLGALAGLGVILDSGPGLFMFYLSYLFILNIYVFIYYNFPLMYLLLLLFILFLFFGGPSIIRLPISKRRLKGP